MTPELLSTAYGVEVTIEATRSGRHVVLPLTPT
jgi:hypothetical protein